MLKNVQAVALNDDHTVIKIVEQSRRRVKKWGGEHF